MTYAEIYFTSRGDIKYIKQFYATSCKAAKINYNPKQLVFTQGKRALLRGSTKFIENFVQNMNMRRKTGIVAKLSE